MRPAKLLFSCSRLPQRNHSSPLQKAILNAVEEEQQLQVAKEEAFFKIFQRLVCEDEQYVGELLPEGLLGPPGVSYRQDSEGFRAIMKSLQSSWASLFFLGKQPAFRVD